MKVNDLIHGFRVKSATKIDEIGAVMWRMEYEKNGADLIWLDREDEGGNKVFGIGFKTVPSDSTGIFHIIEHSVLCGSEKYPTREPFVELIKSSLHTFLNAITYPDRTVYPIASRNDRDFLNLTDVYLDAVLHPLSVRSPLAFRQEGWHYELDADTDTVTCNGVVYNEMKGAYASPDRRLGAALEERLFPDNCYGFSSGGDPAHIPELTFEQYKEGHRRFYSPSNARIFLDGKIPFEETFEKLDSYLREFDRTEVDSDIPLQAPVAPEEYVGEYAVGQGEQTGNRALLAEGRVYGDYTDTEKTIALSVIADVLAGSNEAPLSKAIIGGGLAEDVSLSVDNGLLQEYVTLTVRNADPDRRGEIWDAVAKVIDQQIRDGIDRDELFATLNSYEFSSREKDFGSTPKGLVYGLSTFDSWLYGGDPAAPLREEEHFRVLRARINDGSGYFENLLKEVFVDCRHVARVCLVPSADLAERTLAEEAERCEKAKLGWSDADRRRVVDELAELRAFQNTPDTPEQLATIPMLRLTDINDAVKPARMRVSEAAGRPLLLHPQDTNGIVYGRLYFDISDLSDEELHTADLLQSVLGELATADHTALEIMNITKAWLGAFSPSVSVRPDAADGGRVTVTFDVMFSALESNAARIPGIVSEILNRTQYTAEDEIAAMLRQSLLGQERAITMRGNGYASRRAAASSVLSAAVEETVSGFSQLRWKQAAVKAAESGGMADICRALAGLAARIFVRERAVLSITGNVPEGWAGELLGCLAASPAPVGPARSFGLLPKENIGIVIPADTSFACKAGNFKTKGYGFSGVLSVADQFLTYDWLWLQVRVNGGAYGTGLRFRRCGQVAFTSYRDPQAARSLGVYDRSGDHIREAVGAGENFEKYIISTLSKTEPLLTPKTESARDDGYWFCNVPLDAPQTLRAEILAVTPEKLLAAADLLDAVCADAAVCVVGSEEKIKACGGIITRTEPLK
jgi:Zn-dependent M16 (insulinase) family peptidase